jgi:hypothetical protein
VKDLGHEQNHQTHFRDGIVRALDPAESKSIQSNFMNLKGNQYESNTQND